MSQSQLETESAPAGEAEVYFKVLSSTKALHMAALAFSGQEKDGNALLSKIALTLIFDVPYLI